MDFQKSSAVNSALLCKQHQGKEESISQIQACIKKMHISQSHGNNDIIEKHNCLKLSYMSNEISHSTGYWGITLTSLIQFVQSEKCKS